MKVCVDFWPITCNVTHRSVHWTLNIQVFSFLKTDLGISEDIISADIKQCVCDQ